MPWISFCQHKRHLNLLKLNYSQQLYSCLTTFDNDRETHLGTNGNSPLGDLSLKSVGNKWNNSITISTHKVYKISIEFFSLKGQGDFLCHPHPSPTAYRAPVAINKLQENDFSTVSQRFSYLPATAVTYPKAPIWHVYGWKYDCLCSSVAEEHYPIMLWT